AHDARDRGRDRGGEPDRGGVGEVALALAVNVVAQVGVEGGRDLRARAGGLEQERRVGGRDRQALAAQVGGDRVGGGDRRRVPGVELALGEEPAVLAVALG